MNIKNKVPSLLLLYCLKVVLSEYVTVNNTVSGDVRGFREQVLGAGMDIFLGIPYAVPPVRERRFKRPEMIPPWTSIKDATQFPNACYQMVDTMYGQFEGVDMWNANTPMSEDCLYLNIWTPSDRPFGKLRAVLVWIYGGSYTSGSSSLDVYDGRILAVKGDVVVVSINYRLGALGFLYHGTSDIPGNMGVLDQAVALQWIHNNIEGFGGDNRRVTVFGESAGSASASLLLLSPTAKDFINSVILMSGTASNRWAIDDTAKSKSKFNVFADLVGCTGDNTSVIECLMDADPDVLSTKTWDVSDGSRVPTPFAPVVDGHFLTDTPKNLLAKGQAKKANIMLGSVKNEGTYFMLYNAEYISYFNLEENDMTKEEFIESVGAVIENKNMALKELLAFQYTHPQSFSSKFNFTSQYFLNAIDAMITDTAFICPMIDYSKQQTSAANSVYMYMFDHRTSLNPWPEWMGIMHGYEIDHVFGAPLNDSKGYQPHEKVLSETIINYWTNFAKSGNPNKGDNQLAATATQWPQYSLDNKEYLIFKTTELSTSQGLRDKMCTFWNKIYPSLESQLSDSWEPCADAAPHSTTVTSVFYVFIFINFITSVI